MAIPSDCLQIDLEGFLLPLGLLIFLQQLVRLQTAEIAGLPASVLPNGLVIAGDLRELPRFSRCMTLSSYHSVGTVNAPFLYSAV